jgi:uncharacterized protein YbaR (Trm112 family)
MLRPPGPIASSLFDPASRVKYFIAYILGGNISGLCRKAGEEGGRRKTIAETLICPSCKEAGTEVLLTPRTSSFLCPQCTKVYPEVDRVVFLFAYDKFSALYPEVFGRIAEYDDSH